MYWVSSPKLDRDKANALIGRSDLLRYPIISYEAGTHNHGKLLEYLRGYEASAMMMHYSNSLTTTISMISNGLGISLLPPIVIQNELRTGELRVLNVQPTFPVTLLCRSSGSGVLASLFAYFIDRA